MQKINSALQFSKSNSKSSSVLAKDHDTHWVPNTDVYLTDGAVVIKVELAGMQREDLELTVEGHRVRISGQRPDGCRPPQCKFLVMEINYGCFETVIELPEGYDLTRAKAAYQNEFLRIEVPMGAQAPRSISVSDD